jgi:hypothetical protein
MTRLRLLALLAVVGLIVLPTVALAQTTTSPATGLAGIAGKYVRVWGFDSNTQSWRLYDPAVPAVSDLTTLARGSGYWILVTDNVTLTYNGNTYFLYKGWNLIGWLG